MPEKFYLISESDLALLKQYLYGRPYAEVCKGVAMLDGLRPAPELPPAPAVAAVPDPKE